MSAGRGKGSFGEGKSPSGEEKVLSSGKHFTLARNDVYDRGKILKVRLSSSTNQVRPFVDGSCGRVEMGRCGDRPTVDRPKMTRSSNNGERCGDRPTVND